jgi:hypothetical protein
MRNHSCSLDSTKSRMAPAASALNIRLGNVKSRAPAAFLNIKLGNVNLSEVGTATVFTMAAATAIPRPPLGHLYQ